MICILVTGLTGDSCLSWEKLWAMGSPFCISLCMDPLGPKVCKLHPWVFIENRQNIQNTSALSYFNTDEQLIFHGIYWLDWSCRYVRTEGQKPAHRFLVSSGTCSHFQRRMSNILGQMGRVQRQGTDSVVHQKVHIKLGWVDNAFLHPALFSEDDTYNSNLLLKSSTVLKYFISLPWWWWWWWWLKASVMLDLSGMLTLDTVASLFPQYLSQLCRCGTSHTQQRVRKWNGQKWPVKKEDLE